VICWKRKARNFSRQVWTVQITLNPLRKFVLARIEFMPVGKRIHVLAAGGLASPAVAQRGSWNSTAPLAGRDYFFDWRVTCRVLT
jgi:hypothetical protein